MYTASNESAKPRLYELARSAMVSAVVSTFVGAAVSFFVMARFDSRTSDRQFLFSYNRTFLDMPKYRNISTMVEDLYLAGNVDAGKLDDAFSDYDIDDYLSLLSELDLYVSRGFLSKDIVNDQFGYYVCVAHNSSELNRYISKIQSVGPSRFSSVQHLAAVLGIAKGQKCE